jgi:bifunctional non-homologous end joining protein LigD
MAASSLAEYRRKRDFRRTPEPPGAPGRRAGAGLAFVVQKHAASHLHFDLRLEAGGVMKSWAVPKGPSLDPAVKRLAVEVEDHPMEYNSFEGTIPRGEYGGGTVMLWDRGTYTVDDLAPGEDPERALLAAHRRGKLSVTFHGERLRGSWALVRTRRGDDEDGKPQWLLIKHEDDTADPERDLAAEATTSVDSGRTMEEIAAGRGGKRTWRSNRAKPGAPAPARREESVEAALPDLSALRPMLATSAAQAPEGEGWTFEPKYDGIRVLAFATADSAVLLTRNGNDKARQFPEAAEALRALAADVGRPVVLDGEVVAVSEGRPGRFGEIQGRMHLEDEREIRRGAADAPVSLVVFDVLLDGDEVWTAKPWTERRAALEGLLRGRTTERLRLGETTADREALLERGRAEGWEGVVAKRTDAPYEPGARTSAWRKLKLEHRQEFVVGGWTEPRNSRQHIGALLLGYYDGDGRLVYAGHTGTGFTQKGLVEMARRLGPLERKTSPFSARVQTNQPAHWASPRVVVEVRFNQWTAEGKLRQPVFLGVRDDKDARDVVREPTGPAAGSSASGGGVADVETAAAGAEAAPAKKAPKRARRGAGKGAADVVAQVEAVRAAGGDGVLDLPDGRLEVSNLGKAFFTRPKRTKGDLLAYYARMGDTILPSMKDRPLVLRRFPDGIGGDAFYQQSAPDEVPPGVRVETIVSEDGASQRRLVGGSLATLLYTIQLGAVSYDPWHSRVGKLDFADYTILDLDPGPGASFRKVIHVARWVREELDRFGLHGALKTSGSTGLHIYLPLPPRTPLEAATLVAQIIATRVASLHPETATVERMTRRRPRGTVYVDYLQNILGKTVAGVYAVRAKPGATVSTPLRWDELTDDLNLRDFTMDTVPARVAEVGDLWAEAMKRPNKLTGLLKGAR